MFTVTSPIITVLMPVFNAGAFVKTSIESVLEQTFGNFELLIIDDGSNDKTEAIVGLFQDERIRFIQNEKNLGVARTLNHGLRLARGKYIARMDADDICYPERLKKQFDFMEENPNIGISGTWVRYFGDQPPVVERCPAGPNLIKAFMLFGNPLFHPSVIMRKEYLERNNLRYDPCYDRSEDFELWLRASESFDLDNIELPLLRFRCHESSITSVASKVMKKQACELLGRGLDKLNIPVSEQEMLFHYTVSKGQRLRSVLELCQAEDWLTKLVLKNDKLRIYDRNAFRSAVGIIWFRLCRNSANLGSISWKMSKGKLIEGCDKVPFLDRFRFMVSILVCVLLKIIEQFQIRRN